MHNEDARWQEFQPEIHIPALRLKKDFPPIPAGIDVQAYVLVVGEDVTCGLFLFQLAKGTFEVRLVPGADFHKHRVVFSRKIEEDIEDFMVTVGAERLQANTPDAPLFYRFMTRMGFTREAVMRKFSAGNNHVLWARFRESA